MRNEQPTKRKSAATIIRSVAITLTVLLTTPGLQAQEIDRTRAITLREKSMSRVAAIGEIEAQTQYKVTYNRRSFDEKGVVDFGRKEIAFGALLDKMLDKTGHGYVLEEDRLIVIYKNAAANPASIVSVTDNRAITGVITDTNGGNAQDGVKVELLNTNAVSAITHGNGRFRIEGIAPGNHVVKLTSADGTVRYHEVVVPAGADPEVKLSIEGDTVKQADNAVSYTQETAQATPSASAPLKTTSYYLPSAVDNTVKASSNEAKTEFTFIPSSRMNNGYLAKSAIKTNLLVLATTTPNMSVEFGLARKWTLDLAAAYNPFQLQKGGINLFWIVQPEVRYWFCNRFEKHFIGLYGNYGQFNIGDVTFLTRTFETHRYDGWGAGAGLTYGYHLPMGNRWGWEFTVGVGYEYLRYNKYRCYECDEFVAKKDKHYFGPTKLGVSLVFMIK